MSMNMNTTTIPMSMASLDASGLLASLTKLDVTVGVCAVLFAFAVKYSRSSPLSYPGPPCYPLIGHLLQFLPGQPFIEHATKALMDWSERYESPMVQLRIPGSSMIFLNKGEDIKELFVNRSRNYSDRPRVVMLNELMGAGWAMPFKNFDESLRTDRRIFAQLVGSKDIVHDTQIQAIRRLLHRFLRATPGGHDDPVRLMTGDAILNATYGIIPRNVQDKYISRSSRLLHLVTESTKRGYFLVDIFPWLQHIPYTPMRRFGQAVQKQFTDARTEPFEHVRNQLNTNMDHVSLAAHFIDVRERVAAEGKEHRLREEDLKSTLASFYLAAADTTYVTTLSFMLILALHPEVQHKAQAAIDAHFGGARLPDYEQDWRNVPYIDALLAETHRYNPPAPMGIPHVATDDDSYQGVFIPKGTMIIGNIFSLFRDPEVFDSDVDEFRPERFLNADGTINKERENHIYNNVFGWGRRACPGAELAREFTWLIAISLLSAYDLTDARDVNGVPHDPYQIFKKYSQGPLSRAPFYTIKTVPRDVWKGELATELAKYPVHESSQAQ